MANKYRYRKGPMIDRWIPKSGTVAIELGDLLQINSANTLTLASSNVSTALVGVAMAASPATDASGQKVRFAEIGHGTVFEFDVAASDLHKYGQLFTISGNQQLTKKTSVDPYKTSTNVVAVCAETADASASVVLVQFLPGRFQKPIALRLGAGINTATSFGAP